VGVNKNRELYVRWLNTFGSINQSINHRGAGMEPRKERRLKDTTWACKKDRQNHKRRFHHKASSVQHMTAPAPATQWMTGGKYK